MPEMQPLETSEQLDTFLHTPGVAVLYKHSNRCPIALAALGQVEQALAQPGSESVAWAMIDVVGHRDVSLAAAERLGIPHQSPQIFVLTGGEVHWHTSHGSITAKAIQGALQNVS